MPARPLLTYICPMFIAAWLVSLWNQLDHWDKSLFMRVNGRWTSSFMDAIVPYVRNAVFWTPLYLLLLVFILANFGKRGLWWCLIFICTVALTDSIGAQ